MEYIYVYYSCCFKNKNVYADETCEVEGLSLSFLTVVNGDDMLLKDCEMKAMLSDSILLGCL